MPEFSDRKQTNQTEKEKQTHMSTNKTTMTVEDVEVATTALKGLHDKMPFLQPLPESERATKKRLGPGAVRTAEKRLAAAQAHRDALPVSFDLKRFERDVALMSALDRCVATVTRLRTDLQDTLHGVGLRGMSAANEAYVHIRAASTAAPGLTQTVNQLGRRVKRQARKTEPPGASSATTPAATAPTPSPPAPAPENKAA
jgi:hypothetical protein